MYISHCTHGIVRTALYARHCTHGIRPPRQSLYTGDETTAVLHQVITAMEYVCVGAMYSVMTAMDTVTTAMDTVITPMVHAHTHRPWTR
jgi:hypothetical protein